MKNLTKLTNNELLQEIDPLRADVDQFTICIPLELTHEDCICMTCPFCTSLCSIYELQMSPAREEQQRNAQPYVDLNEFW